MPHRIRVSFPLRSRCLNARPFVRPTLPPSQPVSFTPLLAQSRPVSILASLSDNRSAYQKRIRRGRGPASGKGKTAGRGHKGQKQHGKVPAGFEGGQTPLKIVHGERGFKNLFSLDFQTVPLARIQSWIAQGRIDPSKPITPRELFQSRCVHKITDGIKLLADSNHQSQSIDEVGKLSQPLHIVVSRSSASAIAAVEKAGGTVTTRYYTKWALQQIVKGRMDPMISLQSAPKKAFAVPPTADAEAAGTVERKGVPKAPVAPFAEPALPRQKFQRRLPDATSRKAIEYYRDPARRGYLSHMVEEGKGPSLFFRTPEEDKARLRALVGKGGRMVRKNSAENQLW